MAKWWNFCNGDLVKCQNVMVFFSYLRLLLSPPTFLARLNVSGGGFPRRFLLHFLSSHPLHLCLRLPLPITHNLVPLIEFIYIPLPLPRYLCPPHAYLSLSIPLPLPHHLHPPFEPHYLFLFLSILHIPHISPNNFLVVTHIQTWAK